MKAFVNDAFKIYIVSSSKASTYWKRKNSRKCLSINFEFIKESSFLWLSMMSYAKEKKNYKKWFRMFWQQYLTNYFVEWSSR